MENDSVCGTAFPFRIDPATGGVALQSGTDKIRQNVRLILGTRIGERPMLRDFGSRVASLVQDPNDAVLAEVLKNQTREALLQWEPRILVTESQIERQADGEVTLRIAYMHTNEPVEGEAVLSVGNINGVG